MHSPQSSPAFPPAADSGGRVRFDLRYDDLTQHAHLKLTTLPNVLGRACFDQLWTRHPLFDTRKQGIVPILSRLVLESEPIAVSLSGPLEGRGRIELAHERDGAAVSALFLNAYGELWAKPSRRERTLRSADRLVRVGRAFGEHVLTRPFGEPSERKVLSFDVPGQLAVPSAEHRRVRVDETASLPPGANALDPDFVVDEANWSFGLVHTDLNQHVNSIVYARMFEDAALRRCAWRLAPTSALLARKLELSYRKPCFAGQSLQCMVQCFELNGELGAIGYLAERGTPKERAHCSFRLQFRNVLS
jgi:hypothetical protein